jgi:NAD+ kinase
VTRKARTATVFTHRRPSETAGALKRLCDTAERLGVTLFFDGEETRKHGLQPSAQCFVVNAEVPKDVDLCLCLGGDGTILHALRLYAGTGVPVFGVNFGEVGFLATVEPDGLDDAFRRAFEGDYETLSLPAIELTDERDAWLAMNDVSIHRKPGLRVADLAYQVTGDEIGRVRCDGIVVATPAGSTGYNLANGGPVMAWGVEGYAVSFIAPHSLTARALVVAPTDTVVIQNRSQEEPADVSVDGRPVCEIAPGGAIRAGFLADVGTLAQLPGASFYHRLREKFGRLAT